jgi:broad specificity phosphatase PhoE
MLIERNFGEAEGMRYDEWRDRYPDSKVPGGESIEELELRCHRLLEHLLKTYEGQRALAVSHGSFIRKLLNLASYGELPREGERLGNASLSVIHFDGNRWSVIDYRPETLS